MSDAMDQLEQRVSEFFMNAKKNKPEWREEQMASIKKVSAVPWTIVSHMGPSGRESKIRGIPRYGVRGLRRDLGVLGIF